MSANKETIELLAAPVDTSTALKGDRMLSLDGPGAAFHSGVREPENALGMGETWASFDVACHRECSRSFRKPEYPDLELQLGMASERCLRFPVHPHCPVVTRS
jgi:hypothetical protein